MHPPTLEQSGSALYERQGSFATAVIWSTADPPEGRAPREAGHLTRPGNGYRRRFPAARLAQYSRIGQLRRLPHGRGGC
jgi:hypothetical protein